MYDNLYLDKRVTSANQKGRLTGDAGKGGCMLTYGNTPQCKLCGGFEAPIVSGQHLAPERWCIEDTFNRCEVAYRRCVKHWQSCAKKACADGEWGDKAKMCKAGRILTEQWEAAESKHQAICYQFTARKEPTP